MRSIPSALAAAAALVLLSSGCGGDSDSGTAAVPTSTKAAFIKRADAICERTDREQKKGQVTFSREHPEDPTRTLEEEAVATVGLPPVQEEAEELGRLTPPEGDEARIGAIVRGLEEAVWKAESNPDLLLKESSSGPFTEVFKLAKEYGFKACATPL